MRGTFYWKLAKTNIIKNKNLYYPYILTCICTIMLFFIMHGLSLNEGIRKLDDAAQMSNLLALANRIMAVLSLFFLLYTNSFLMKRRTTELGLYNILGLEKRHIARLMLCENIIVSAVSLGVGILGGILFSRLVFLIYLNMLQFDTGIEYKLPISSIPVTIALFLAAFFALYLISLIRVQKAKPIDLLKSDQLGEKEPKARWWLAILGAAALAIGYYMAVTVNNAMDVITVFIPAVLLVILGTYFLFTAGSIALLKLLKKNKRYYYKSNHFTTVSGMLYRMKQNAAGLAVICVLSTATLVLLASTVSLYVGKESYFLELYPANIAMSKSAYNALEYDIEADLNTAIAEASVDTGIQVSKTRGFLYTLGLGTINGNNLRAVIPPTSESYCFVQFMLLSDYNKFAGTSLELSNNEILVDTAGVEFSYDTLVIGDETFDIADRVEIENLFGSNTMYSTVGTIMIFVKDLDTMADMAAGMEMDLYEDEGASFSYAAYIDIEGGAEEEEAFMEHIENGILGETPGDLTIEGREESRSFYMAAYGGFFFLGLYLGTMFLLATTLIIYYKQIAEGYQDQKRFFIMQKVGMGIREIKRTIGNQILMVFFLPLAGACLHLAFAYHIIQIGMQLLGLVNNRLYFICTLCCVAVFALSYGLIYLFTAKAYYKIIRVQER